jgi:hypothetical protein
MLPAANFEILYSKTKVHPAMFMKTNEREKVLAPNAWKDAEREQAGRCFSLSPTNDEGQRCHSAPGRILQGLDFPPA